MVASYLELGVAVEERLMLFGAKWAQVGRRGAKSRKNRQETTGGNNGWKQRVETTGGKETKGQHWDGWQQLGVSKGH